jgi:glycosyltransferase involved in cell wall biosynthesis
MKYQLEQLDLLRPWPQLTLRDGYHAIQILVRLGAIPVGEVFVRPARKRVVSHRGLRRLIARKHATPLLKNILREGLASGPEALMSVPADAFPPLTMAQAEWRKTLRFVQDELLLPDGLPEPMRSWVVNAQARRSWAMPAVTVAVCTRDRESILEGCIRHLQGLDYPKFEILVVDNSRDPVPTHEIAQRCGVEYVRCPKGGLSRARNAAIANARHDWIAFTDDDCRPEANWLMELVRPVQDQNCRCVCGLVLPAQLENAAEITFEIYGGLGRGCAPRVLDPGFLTTSYSRPAQTWRIGAGANMLLHKGLMQQIGGFDIDMGPGPRSVGGCGEDTDVFYQVLREGYNIHYAPRAIVHHFHRSSPKALRRQIYSYAVGHAAYHTRCLFAYGDYRSLIQLAWHLPRWFARNLKRGVNGKTKYPFSLVFLEIRGTVVGPLHYGAMKVRRMWKNALVRLRAAAGAVDPVVAEPASAVKVATPVLKSEATREEYGAHAGNESFRAA